MKNKKTWAVGDTCWYEESWSGCFYECEIIKIKYIVDKKNGTTTPYATIKNKNPGGIQTFDSWFEKLAESRDELVARNNAVKDAYLTEINSKDDLIHFMFNHCINGVEYTDEEAREAVIEKMTEFGINTEN